jgi:monoamine oxidase
VSHSVLFQRCRRLLETACLLESNRVATRDGLGRLEERAFARRALLRGSVGVGAAILAGGAGGCATASTPRGPWGSSNPRIVIVGAGLAGLSAAYRLGELGFRPSIYEASDRLGGRAYTLHDYFASKAELGGELIDSGQTTIRTLVPQLGLHLLDLTAGEGGLEPVRYFFADTRYSEIEMIDSFRPVAARLLLDRRALDGRFSFSNFDRSSEALRSLDRMSVEEWLTSRQVHEPARSLIDAAYAAEYGRDIGEQSCLNLLLMVGTNTSALQIYGESDWRFTVAEGSDAIARELGNRLPAPVDYGHVFESVQERSDGTLAVVFRVGHGTREVIADRLAITIPFTQLRRCNLALALPPATREAIDSLQYGLHAKVLVGTTSRPWRVDRASGTSFHDSVFQASWDSAVPGERGVLTLLSGGRVAGETTRGTMGEQASRNLIEAGRLFAGTSEAYDGRAARVYWPSMPFNLGSYACYAPGQYTGIGGHEGVAVRNVHFGGEHTSKAYQGWLVGAIESGERVAREIATALSGASA